MKEIFNAHLPNGRGLSERIRALQKLARSRTLEGCIVSFELKKSSGSTMADDGIIREVYGGRGWVKIEYIGGQFNLRIRDSYTQVNLIIVEGGEEE